MPSSGRAEEPEASCSLESVSAATVAGAVLMFSRGEAEWATGTPAPTPTSTSLLVLAAGAGGCEEWDSPLTGRGVLAVLVGSSNVDGVEGVTGSGSYELLGGGVYEGSSLSDSVFPGTTPLPTELPCWMGAASPLDAPSCGDHSVGGLAGGAGCVGSATAPPVDEPSLDSSPAATAPAGASRASATAIGKNERQLRRCSSLIS